MRGLHAAATAVLAAVVLGGCAAGTDATVPSGPTPQAGPVTTAVMQTRGLGTARLAVTATATLPSGTRTLTGSGTASLDRGTGELRLTTPDGRTTEQRRTGKGLFVRTGDPSALWTVHPEPLDVPGGAFTDPLRGLGSLRDTRVRRSEGATVVVGQVPATPEQLRQLGLGAADLAALPPGWQDSEVTITVVIDRPGRVVEVTRAWAAAGASAEVTTRLDDFRAPLNLTVPPSASVATTITHAASS